MMKRARDRSKRRAAQRRHLRLETLEQRKLLTGFANVVDKLDETVPGAFAGAAWFDFNNDGRDDLFVNGIEGGKASLYRNEGNGDFTNVAEQAGVAAFSGYAGANAGDIDNDGFVDLVLVGRESKIFGADAPDVRVLRNLGDSTFLDVTQVAAIAPPQTPGSAAFADIDRDGDIDLFITSTGALSTKSQHGSKLYRNNGDFTFSDITEESGVKASLGACVTAFTDYDDDGDGDLLVGNCNDINFTPTPVQLFRNDGTGHFENVSRDANLNSTGFWMGISLADYDNDGNVDIHSTNAGTTIGLFPHALLQNNGDGTFKNAGSRVGVSRGQFGWGTSSADFNNDGLADILYAGTLAAGVQINANFIGMGVGNPGRLFMNGAGDLGQRRSFTDATDELGIDLSNTHSGAVATSDFDNNGTIDVFLPALSRSRDGSESVLLQNNMGLDSHWVGVKLTGTVSNRDAIGAKITVYADDLIQTREVYGGSSFLSTNSFSQRFGLADYEGDPVVSVRWPTGVEEVFRSTGELDSVLALTEGEGEQPLAGDLNHSGEVDFADFLALSANFGKEHQDWRHGDFNADNTVDFADFLVLSANFGLNFGFE